MANGGFRTQEARLLKWKDIKKITTADKDTFAEVVVRAENTKVSKTRTIEMRRGAVFKRIKGYSKYTEREDFVFSTYDKNEVLSKKNCIPFSINSEKSLRQSIVTLMKRNPSIHCDTSG